MNRFFQLAALALAFTIGAAAQDCTVSFTLTAAPSNSISYLNLTGGCTFWTVTYSNTGFSAISLDFQSAPNVGGVAGTWTTFAGTTVTGINPNTDAAQASSTFTGYYPFVRVSLDSATGSGTVKGTFYGWREQPPTGGGSVPDPLAVKGCGGAGSPPACDPVLIAGVDTVGDVVRPLMNLDGGATASLDTGAATSLRYETDFTCNLQAAVALTTSGLSQIIALTSQSDIRVCHLSMSGDTSVNVKFSTGTGSNCGTGTADLTGLYYQTNALAFDFSNHAALRVPISQALCVSLSGASNWGGIVIYGKFAH